MDDNQDDPVRYVAQYYYTNVLKKTYEENIKPVNGEKFWKKTNKPPIKIPAFRKPRGRPKNRDRRKEPFEDLQNAGKSTRHGRIPHCSQCKQTGHIKSGCKNEPVVVEGPKNRRGRPRKHPNEDHLRPPTKRRTRRKTTATESSSQPTPSAETSYAVVSSSQPIPSSAFPEAAVSCSAPQPTTSTSSVKPHVKKASRGRPLKITKTAPVPYGVGTFWSPFTDRPFEVFGNRVYDRQPPQDPSRQPPQDPSRQPPQDPSRQPPQDPSRQPPQDTNREP